MIANEEMRLQVRERLQVHEVTMTDNWWKTKKATKVSVNPEATSFCQYHHTTVVSWTKTHAVLNSGGHRTQTTKQRINQCADYYNIGFWVFQKRNDWYVSQQSLHICNELKGFNVIPFEDGMKIKIKRRKPKCLDCNLELLARVP